MATYYTATSIDGFIATPDDSVAFLEQVPQPSEDTYTPFMETVGTIAMGRATYEFMLAHIAGGGEWPYPQTCWVFTHQKLAAVPGADVRFVQGAVADAHVEMQAAAGGKQIWVVGGGDLAAQFLAAGLLEEIIVTVASRTLGAGKPLLPVDATWKLVSARALGEGFAELRYKPAG